MRYDNKYGDILVRLALALPTLYHGFWNLSAEGYRFWSTSSGLPTDLRWIIGSGEVFASLAIVSGVQDRLAAGLLVPIFLGAIHQHFGAGFSFKKIGWEVPFVYLLVSLAIACGAVPHSLKTMTQQKGHDR